MSHGLLQSPPLGIRPPDELTSGQNDTQMCAALGAGWSLCRRTDPAGNAIAYLLLSNRIRRLTAVCRLYLI